MRCFPIYIAEVKRGVESFFILWKKARNLFLLLEKGERIRKNIEKPTDHANENRETEELFVNQN